MLLFKIIFNTFCSVVAQQRKTDSWQKLISKTKVESNLLLTESTNPM